MPGAERPADGRTLAGRPTTALRDRERRGRGRARDRGHAGAARLARRRRRGARRARPRAAGGRRLRARRRARRAAGALRVLAPTATSRWRPSACPAAPSPCSPSDAVDLEAERARAAERADALRGEIARAEGKLANQGFVAKAPADGGRRPSARSSSGCKRGAGRAVMSARGTSADAEEHLLSLELFGMRFGLERMRRLLTALGSPQERFRAIHVVGTNGKSSTVRMTAALLEAHGVRTGAYLSPHLTSLRRADPDRRRRPRPARASAPRSSAPRRPRAKVDRTLDGRRARDPVRAADRRRVRRARARARSRSRSSRPASAGAATPPTCSARRSWCSPTWGSSTRAGSARRSRDIAGEKLAVVRAGRDAGARRRRARGRARWPSATRRAGSSGRGRRRRVEPRCRGYQRTQLRASRAAAAEAHPRRRSTRRRRAPSPRRVRCPGRLQVVAQRPADDLRRRAQPAGHRRARRALPVLADGTGRGACRSSTTRTPPAMLRALLPRAARRRVHPRANPRALPPATLASSPRSSAASPSEIEPDPRARRGSARASWPGRTARCWRPARSTSWPTCSARPGRGGRARCERARPRACSR